MPTQDLQNLTEALYRNTDKITRLENQILRLEMEVEKLKNKLPQCEASLEKLTLERISNIRFLPDKYSIKILHLEDRSSPEAQKKPFTINYFRKTYKTVMVIKSDHKYVLYTDDEAKDYAYGADTSRQHYDMADVVLFDGKVVKNRFGDTESDVTVDDLL